MAEGISINGQKLHEIRMPLVPHCKGVVASLLYPKSEYKFSLEKDTLQLTIPPLLGLELYRSGVLPQNSEIPVKIAIGGKSKGQFTVTDVRYPGNTGVNPDKIAFRFERAR